MNLHLTMRRVALMLGALCVALLVWYWTVRPTTLTIAVGPDGSVHATYVETIARVMRETRQPVRFKIVKVEDMAEASRRLEAGKVDLAVVRSDDPTSNDARSIVLIHRRSLVVIARKEAAIETIRDLEEKRTGLLVTDSNSFRPLIKLIMSHYEIDADEMELQDIPRAEVAAALASGRIDAVVMMTNPASKLTRSLLFEITGNQKTAIVIKGTPAHEALAFRFRELQTSKIPEGVFGGNPLRPEEDLDTVAITYEIAASSRLSEPDATVLTKTLMEMRTRLRSTQDNTFGIETPPVDEARRFLPHAGAAAFVNNEAKTWFEVYSDHIWLALFGMGIIGSSIAGVMSWAGLQRDAPADSLTSHMRALAGRLEAATSVDEIDAIQGDFDDLVLAIMREYGLRNLVRDGCPDPSPWLSTFSSVLTRRRELIATLNGQPHRQVAGRSEAGIGYS